MDMGAFGRRFQVINSMEFNSYVKIFICNMNISMVIKLSLFFVVEKTIRLMGTPS